MEKENNTNLKEGTNSERPGNKKFRFYSIIQVSLATFFASPIVGTILMARNFIKLGMKDEAFNSIMYGVFITIAQVVLVYLIPYSSILIPIIGILIVQKYYGKKQKKYYDDHIIAGGLKGSPKIIALIVILGICFATLIVTVSFIGTEEIADTISYNVENILEPSKKKKIILFVKEENLSIDQGLYLACRDGSQKAIDYYLKKGANINASHGSFTPLSICAHEGIVNAPEIVSYLISMGADVNGVDSSNGQTTLNNVLTWLNFSSYQYERHMRIIYILLENGADVNILGEDSIPALLKVIESEVDKKDCIEIVNEIIYRGVNIDITNNYGQNALMYAAFNGRLELVNYLLEAGIDINAKDKSGKSALDWAKESNPMNMAWSYNHDRIVNLLLEKGALE